MAWQSGAVARLRALPSPDVLLRVLLLHVARGYSLRETVVRAKLANWSEISDVALVKRLRNSEEWLRFLCVELFRENVACRLEEAISRTIRIVDGTIVREPGKTGSQWRILYSVRLPSLVLSGNLEARLDSLLAQQDQRIDPERALRWNPRGHQPQEQHRQNHTSQD